MTCDSCNRQCPFLCVRDVKCVRCVLHDVWRLATIMVVQQILTKNLKGFVAVLPCPKQMEISVNFRLLRPFQGVWRDRGYHVRSKTFLHNSYSSPFLGGGESDQKKSPLLDVVIVLYLSGAEVAHCFAVWGVSSWIF